MKTLRNSSISLALLALALLVSAPAALADILGPYTGTVPPTTTDLSNVTASDIPAFNTSLGTLQSVQISFTGNENTTFTITNTSNSPQTFTAAEVLYLTLNNTNGGINALLASNYNGVGNLGLPDISASTGGSVTLAAFRNVGDSQTFGPFNLSSTPVVESFSSPADLLLFEGIGNLSPFEVTTLTGYTFIGGGGNLSTSQNTTAGADITVTYDYTPPGPPAVPEPGTLSLFGTGLLGLAGMLRSKFAKS